MELEDFLTQRFRNALGELSQLPALFKEQFFVKKAMITDYGQIERKLYFINTGLVQLTILHQGEEKIVEFFSEGEFVCAYTSFLRQEASDVRITALTKCRMQMIEYNELQKLYRTSLTANQLGRIFTEEIYIAKTKREKDFLTKSAKERYEDLIAARPLILQFVSVNKIAGYLGIHPESLSRIRKSLIS